MALLTRNNPAPLRPEDLKIARAVTVVDTVVNAPAPRTRTGLTTYCLLVEFPGKGFYLNEGDKETLIEAFKSQDTDAFKGRKIPIHIRRVDNFKADTDPREPAQVDVVRVVPLDEWAEYADQGVTLPSAQKQTRKRSK